MVAVRQDLIAEERGTLTFEVQVLDEGGVNPDTSLTGWTGAMQVRAARDEDSVLLATAAVTVEPTTGVVTAVIDADDLDTDWTSGQYDLKITDGSRVEWLAWGTVRFYKRVTT